MTGLKNQMEEAQDQEDRDIFLFMSHIFCIF
jgi:hypothetical protein